MVPDSLVPEPTIPNPDSCRAVDSCESLRGCRALLCRMLWRDVRRASRPRLPLRPRGSHIHSTFTQKYSVLRPSAPPQISNPAKTTLKYMLDVIPYPCWIACWMIRFRSKSIEPIASKLT